jgi:hypothetical protein
VRYHLLDEKRRARIGYENREPIAYEVYARHGDSLLNRYQSGFTANELSKLSPQSRCAFYGGLPGLFASAARLKPSPSPFNML